MEPQINKIFERCSKVDRQQYKSFEKYVNYIKTMSKRCDFENITVNEIIKDKIINGMRNDNLRIAKKN